MKRTFFVTLAIFSSTILLAGTQYKKNMIYCNNDHTYTTKYFSQKESDQTWTGLVDSEFMWTKIPSEDVQACAYNNNFKNVVVGGIKPLAILEDVFVIKEPTLQEASPFIGDNFKCFCKINSNLLEGCFIVLDEVSFVTYKKIEYVTCEKGKTLRYIKEGIQQYSGSKQKGEF